MSVQTLFDSGDYIIVNKPYDMYVNCDDPSEKNTVAAKIASADSHLSSSAQQLHFVHRLDYATSGVLCMAKNKKAAAAAGKLFEKKLAKKYYLAVVRGEVKDACDVEYPVGEDPKTLEINHKMLAVTNSVIASSCQNVRAAATRILPLMVGEYCGEPATMLLMKPFTGRRHQLRVHCAALGHVILGDYTYSDGVDNEPHRMFLHAHRLILPFNQEPLDIQTHEPFLSDRQFKEKWETKEVSHECTTEKDFRNVCDVIDYVNLSNSNFKTYNNFVT